MWRLCKKNTHLLQWYSSAVMDYRMQSARAPRVLLIDDQPEGLGPLIRLFNSQGFQIYQSDSARIGYQRAHAVTPDIILLDLYMPEMDGLAVLRLLQESPQTRNIPVIFLSSTPSTDDRLSGFQLGAVDFVSKPYIPEEVLARVRVHLKRTLQVANLEKRVADKDLGQEEVMLQAALKILQERLSDPPSVVELARAVGTHDKRLLRIFRARLGTTVSAYIRQSRMELARTLLRTDTVSIEEVAAQAGFRNAANFSTAFRRDEGISPRQYRQRCLSES